MKSQFGDISQKLRRARDLFAEQKFDEERTLLDQSIDGIIKLNYFPLLDPFLAERMKLAKATGDVAGLCIDALLRADPHVRTRDAAAVFKEFVAEAEGKGEQAVELPRSLQPLFPVVVRAHYGCESCVAGTQPTVFVSVASKAGFAVDIASVALVLGHDSVAEDEVCEITGAFTLNARGVAKFSAERNVKPAVAVERIEAVIVRIGCVCVRFTGEFCAPLRILPDEGACRIDYVLPKRCIVGAVLPVRVTLAADTQKLENLSVKFASEARPGVAWEPAEVIVAARCGDKDLTKGAVELGSLEAGSSLELELSVKQGAPVLCRIVMTVAFSTALSGVGEFQKEMTFDFVAPFTAHMRMYDCNYQEMTSGVFSFEKGSHMYVETSCLNNMEFPITVLEVKSSMSEIDCVDLPIVIAPGEEFTFIGTVTEAGVAEVSIAYETELTGRCEYSKKTPQLVQFTRGVSFDFVSPATAVRHQEFEAEIIIDNTDGDTELATVMVEVQMSHWFFVNGPTKKIIPVFKGKKRVIPIKFFPLDAGSTTLPSIVLTDTGGKCEPKKFSAPIVITFQ